MIVSYLARIILILQDLSASDNDRLVNIAKDSYNKLEHVNNDIYDFRRNSTLQLSVRSEISREAPRIRDKPNSDETSSEPVIDEGLQNLKHIRNMENYLTEESCIPINDTLRKNLLQVSSDYAVLVL
ncbi:hypothetical protein DICVIV_13546 [Dictyocaulus viviparus]|uniref:Uncharacterized protein n=1 Tax=Dictyocaulus viviparus TaxID=29172 RepID=A0A0D8X7I6_DICVI|nr:hypothetical protein DICVIV_13546 [Dictyocaulus viviparus]